MADFDIGINQFINGHYSLHINGSVVRKEISNLEEVVKEIKKYLRLRFKEPLK